ncbi:hypothetical protein BU24DRAFT_74873 [Aaosphaeria arxii CBS 175.79]|uniref:Uncharacterized protein n=1 Tax=Aaosphaeria arxii CBS 175.79 TaxID=1450172 RepID=A0A6A5X923_9PLEO|nr:uncharacterized protein BU24DRAFT_74873 [Aaosphaeria arxii CBS 175.79]KAF2009423.1 hypothetical protein BU24DRAFT_74873 [Aaosphaeria arxii CBS 175.79]
MAALAPSSLSPVDPAGVLPTHVLDHRIVTTDCCRQRPKKNFLGLIPSDTSHLEQRISVPGMVRVGCPGPSTQAAGLPRGKAFMVLHAITILPLQKNVKFVQLSGQGT